MRPSIFAVFLLAITPAATAQITVRVTASDEKPLAGAIVHLSRNNCCDCCRPNPEVSYSCCTGETKFCCGLGKKANGEGEVRFEGIEPGRYTLQADQPGFTARVSALQVVSGKEEKRELRLRKTSEHDEKTPMITVQANLTPSKDIQLEGERITFKLAEPGCNESTPVSACVALLLRVPVRGALTFELDPELAGRKLELRSLDRSWWSGVLGGRPPTVTIPPAKEPQKR